MKKKLSPRQATTYKQICSLRRDNLSSPNGWIIIDGSAVTLCNQRTGEKSTGQVTFSRKEFHKLIDWYNKPQALARSPR